MGATVAHMRVPDAKKLQIPCPPLETQRRIASILGVYDDLIEVNRRRVAVLEAMARGLMPLKDLASQCCRFVAKFARCSASPSTKSTMEGAGLQEAHLSEASATVVTPSMMS